MQDNDAMPVTEEGLAVQNIQVTEEETYNPLPLLDPEVYSALEASICDTGRVDVPIEVDECGRIIDGRARQQIIRSHPELRIKFMYFLRMNLTEDEKRERALRLNLNRRHLTTGQRKVVAADLLRANSNWSSRRVATLTGLDDKTVGVIKKSMVEIGEIPECHEVLTVKGHTRQVAPMPTILAQSEGELIRAKDIAVRLPPEGMSDKVVDTKRATRLVNEYESRLSLENSEPFPAFPHRLKAVHADFRAQLEQVEPETVSLVLTDVPWEDQYWHLLGDLGRLVSRVLRPGGMMLTYVGGLQFPEVMAALSQHLKWYWPLAVLTQEHPTMFAGGRKITTAYTPVLAFGKPPFMAKRAVLDVFKGEGAEKEFHEHGQGLAEARYWIEMFTEPGELVCDPFLGGATNLIAAAQTGRNFIGCDIDADRVRMAHERLEKEVENGGK